MMKNKKMNRKHPVSRTDSAAGARSSSTRISVLVGNRPAVDEIDLRLCAGPAAGQRKPSEAACLRTPSCQHPCAAAQSRSCIQNVTPEISTGQGSCKNGLDGALRGSSRPLKLILSLCTRHAKVAHRLDLVAQKHGGEGCAKGVLRHPRGSSLVIEWCAVAACFSP